MKSSSWRSLIKETVFGFQIAHRFGKQKPFPLGSSGAGKEDVAQIVTDPDRLLKQQLEMHGLGEVGYQLAGDFTDLLRPLRRAAAQEQVTLNDLLIRDFLLTTERFDTRPSKSAADHYRVMMPCNLRSMQHQADPAANIMSFSFLTRKREDLVDTASLLEGVRAETEYIRSNNASLYFLRSLQLARCIPGGIRRVANSRQCLSTAFLSNLSDPTRSFHPQLTRQAGKIQSGEILLERILAWPPLRPLTRLGLVINTYANQCWVGLSYDHLHLSKADAQKFLQILRDQLTQSCQQT